MNPQPFFSIIMPVYNTARYVREALDSVLAQQFADYELIVADDGSTDRSLDICLDYARRDPRISVLHGSNRGPGHARNQGIRLAKGQYILFLDSDDYWADAAALADLHRLAQSDNLPDLILFFYHTLEEDGGNPQAVYTLDVQGLSGHFAADLPHLTDREMFFANPWSKAIKSQILRGGGAIIACFRKGNCMKMSRGILICAGGCGVTRCMTAYFMPTARAISQSARLPVSAMCAMC